MMIGGEKELMKEIGKEREREIVEIEINEKEMKKIEEKEWLEKLEIQAAGKVTLDKEETVQVPISAQKDMTESKDNLF